MNELVTKSDVMSADVAEAMGVSIATGGGEYLDRLGVNYSVMDDDENDIPIGQFKFRYEGVTYYAPSVDIAVIGMHYQYVKYDAADNKYVCRSLIHPDFRGEFRDTDGTLKCGMTKKRSEMDETELKLYKDVSCQRQLRCLVNMIGKDATGNEKEISNAPALLTLKGANFMPFDEQITRKHRDFRTNWIELSTSRAKNGGNVYYVIDFDWTDQTVDMGSDDYSKTVMHFLKLIKDENNEVDRAYDTALAA